MEHYVGLDVSLKLTAICIVDGTGKVVRQGAVVSNPEAQRQPRGGVRQNANENGQIGPVDATRERGMVAAVRTARPSCGKAGKGRVFTPVRSSSGESLFN